MNNLDKKRDLFLNILKNPDKNFEDLINAGFTIDNSELNSKEFYQDNANIKDHYTNSSGVFDLASFDNDYKVMLLIQQNLLSIKDSGKLIDFFTYHRNNFLADEDKKRTGPDFEIFRAPNPFEQTSGIVRIGKSENPIKTAAEIAQGEQVHNLKTDTWEQSPEEASFFSNIFDEAKVLAVYEEDGTHIDPITGETVSHQIGDLKFNSNGKPYYETLNGRDVYGRQVLSNFDVLTREDSKWNRYDFFDNDGYDKSAVGNIIKTAVVVAPMFIPYVGPVYTGAKVLLNAASLFGTLGKIANINDWMDPDTAKWFTNLEGWTKSMSTLDSRSEYAKQHMWSLENMIGLVGDVITLLKEQRWIFEYGPLFFNPNWEATKSLASKKGIDFEKLERNFAKKLQGSKFNELLLTTTKNSKNHVIDVATTLLLQAQREAKEYFTKSQKISEVLSKLYMTGITTLDGYSEAKAAGADDVTAALFALGYAAGEYAIINSRLGDWIFPEKRISAELDRRAATSIYTSLAAAKPAQTATKSEKFKWVHDVFDSAKKKLNSDYIVGMKSQTQTIMDNMLAGGLAEGLEEVTEELWTDVSKSLYNAVLYFRGEEETSMKAWNNVLDRYLMSAIGGAVGGGITSLDLDVTKQLNKEMTFNEAMLRVITMVRNNDKNHEFDQFLTTVSKMDFGDAEIIDGKSGNDLVIHSLKQFRDFIYDVINAENANLSDDHILNTVSKELREDFKWSQLMSPLYKEVTDAEGKTTITPIENSIIGAKILLDINNDLAIILGNTAAIKAEENEKTDLEKRNEEKSPKKEKKKDDDSKVENARKHLQNTLSGALNYEYAQLFLYEYTHMGDKLIPSTFRAFVKMTTGKHLEEFDKEQKAKLKEKYEATKKDRADLLMFLANSHQQISELSKETVEKLAEVYKQNAENEKLKHLTKFLEKLVTFNEDVVSDDMFLERFSQLYNNLEEWYAQVYTERGDKVYNEDGSEKLQKLGLYTALNSAFGEQDDYAHDLEEYLIEVKPALEDDSPEIEELRKLIIDYNEQFMKYFQFVTAINQLSRLVEFYEKQGFINSELKQTLYYLTDKLNKNRTKIELLSNRYSNILKNITKQYYNDLNFNAGFYELMNSIFPGNNFSNLDDFKKYLKEHGDETYVGRVINELFAVDHISLLENTLLDDFNFILKNVQSLYDGYNLDKIPLLEYLNQQLLKFKEGKDSANEDIYNEQIDKIEKLLSELQKALQLTELTRTKLNDLAHTLIEEDLNQFAFSIGEESIFTNLLETLNKHLFENRNSIDSIMLNDKLSKRIDDALWLISMYEDTLNTARTVLYDTTNVWGYNKTLNSIAKKVKSDKELPTLAEIDSETADVFLQDLSLYKKKLKFLKKLYAVNAGQKFAVNDRVELNTAYIFLSKLKKWIGSLEPKQGFEGLDELQKAIDSITVLDKFYDGKDKNFNLSQEDKLNMTKERIKVEDALHTFFNKNIDNLTYEKLKKLFINDTFTISDLFKSRPTIINEKTTDVSFLEFINYLATRAAISASSLRYEVATVIQDEIKSESTKKIVPIPTLVEAAFYPYAKFANPKMILKFTDFKRKLLEEYVNNITKDLLRELTNQGLAPFSKDIITDDTIDEALVRFKNNLLSLSTYPEFEDVISLVEGMPGTGKSFGVDDLIAKMLAKHHKEYLENAIVINTTSETAENLSKALNLKNFYTIEEFLTKYMNNHTKIDLNADGELDVKEGIHYKVINETLIDAIAEPKEGLTLPQIIFVDELPTLNKIQILELSKLARKYNIEIFATGDYNQTTPSGKITINNDTVSLAVNRGKYFFSTKLGVSMRTDNNQKTNNINQAQVAVDMAQYEPDSSILLNLTYMQNELGIFGDKVVSTPNKDINLELLDGILKDIDIMIKTLKKDKNGIPQKINYIFSRTNSKLYKALSENNKYKDYIQFHAGNTSQGKEGQYWIVENDREASKLSTYLLELYTGISRSEQGSIIIASTKYSGNLAKLTLNNTETQVKINEGFDEEIKQKLLEKLIKFYGSLTLDEVPVSIVRNKPKSLKNSLVEELRKVETDASLTGDIIYFTIKSENPLIIKIGNDEIEISKEELINKIKTENYRLTEKVNPEKTNPVSPDEHKELTDRLNNELATKYSESLKRIEPQESQPIINFYLYLYSAFSMETSVEVDEKGNIKLTNKNLPTTDPTDSRIDNIIGLYRYFNRNLKKGLSYNELHEKLNQLRLSFLLDNNKNSIYDTVKDVLDISEELAKDLYITFGYKKTNATLKKEDGNREQNKLYAKADKTDKEIIEYNALGGIRSNEVGVNNLVAIIGFEESGDFLEIPIMRMASPISIMYQTDRDDKFLFLELINFWNSKELQKETTHKKCEELIKKFKGNKKYERIIREFEFYILPNSNYFSISAIDENWLPAQDLTNLGPQIITEAGNIFYSEDGFEFSNNDDNSWIGISKFRKIFKEIVLISKVKMFTSEIVGGVNISNHVKLGHPFILTKFGASKSEQKIIDDNLMTEFLSDIKEGRTSLIRLVYLAKPKITLESYLKKVFNFIFNKGGKTEFGNLFTSYKILEAFFRNKNENNEELSEIVKPHSKKAEIIEQLINKVKSIKQSESDSYTKDEIEQIVQTLKSEFKKVIENEKNERTIDLAFPGTNVSVKTLFDAYLASLLKDHETNSQKDEIETTNTKKVKVNDNALKIIVETVLKNNPKLSFVYADGIIFDSVDGIATLEDSYLLSNDDSQLNAEEFFIHAKFTLPMFFNHNMDPKKDLVYRFMKEVLTNKLSKYKYSKHNYNYFGIKNVTLADGTHELVKNPKYPYGKSKITSTSAPGSEIKVPSKEDIMKDIESNFNDFENSKKNVTDAKTLYNKIMNNIMDMHKNYTDVSEYTDKIASRMLDTLLTNGIFKYDVGSDVKFYNLKTALVLSNYGKYIEYEQKNGNEILIFELKGKRIEYLPIIENGNVNLVRITIDSDLDPTPDPTPDPNPNSKTDPDLKAKLQIEIESNSKILDDFINSTLFESHVFEKYEDIQDLFGSLNYLNFSESFSELLLSCNPSLKNVIIDVLQECINDSNIEETSKTKINEILTKFRTYLKCI